LKNFHLSKKLEDAVIRVVKEVEMQQATKQWNLLTEYDLWYELVACILGSNVRFEQARSFVAHLHNLGLLDIGNSNFSYDMYESKINKILSSPCDILLKGRVKMQKYRYPKMRANHIRKTAELIYGHGNSIKSLLTESGTPSETRYHLMINSVGVGPKQASLFLRNVGYADDLAVLDVHVLRYMALHNLLSCPSKVISSLINYENFEKKLRSYAEKLRTKLSHLDLAIWVVMRVYQREFAL
jgi:N-glycosylase/DNA lyase